MRRVLELGPTGSIAAIAAVAPDARAEMVTVVLASFKPSKEATLHFFVIHAQIILLTFPPDETDAESQQIFQHLVSVLKFAADFSNR